MSGILHIFFNDIRSVISHAFVLAFVVGILFVPAMYAGINIFASSDPYGSTGNLPIAVASYDKGMKLSDGSRVNSADEVIEDLKDDESIDWVILDDPGDAKEGVRSGEYYAAVVFKKGFTKDMHNFKHALSEEKEPIIYYTNTKKNAVAAKITDSAVSELIEDINIKYIKKMLRNFFKDEKDFYDETDPVGTIDKSLEHIYNMRDIITSYFAAIDQFSESCDRAESSLKSARQKLNSGKSRTRSIISKAENDYRQAQTAIEEAWNTINGGDLPMGDKLQFDYNVFVQETRSALDQLDVLLQSAAGTQDSVDPVITSAEQSVSGVKTSLQQLKSTLELLDQNLSDMQHLLKKAKKNLIKEDKIIEKGDSKSFAKYFASPVEVSENYIYPRVPYGVSMTPFYSVLALWVGVVVLVSMINPHTDPKIFPEAADHECYFGRLMIFILLGQLQAAILFAVDVFLLKCDPVSPGLMWAAFAFTSFVFVVLIFSVVLSFGDVGKGMIVVIMVMQIAGSGGSYPIEILPDVFEYIYRFFPMPYAINAIREAIFGTYENDYAVYLAKLSVFLIVGLVTGLFIRKDFVGVDSFVREKLEESEVL